MFHVTVDFTVHMSHPMQYRKYMHFFFPMPRVLKSRNSKRFS